MSQEPSQSPRRLEPLDYGRPEQNNPWLAITLIPVGIMMGAVTVFFVGIFVMSAVGYPNFEASTAQRPLVNRWPTVLFLGLVLAAIFGLIRAWRRPKRSFRWLVIGLLLGVGLMSLLEGFCFATS
jgi:hypothetical protein